MVLFMALYSEQEKVIEKFPIACVSETAFARPSPISKRGYRLDETATILKKVCHEVRDVFHQQCRRRGEARV